MRKGFYYLFLMFSFIFLGCTKEEPRKEEPQKNIPPKTQTVSLNEYLKDPKINEKVTKLALIGFENYQKPPLNAIRTGKPLFGGRTGDWIFQTFNKSEDKIVKELEVEEAPVTFSLKEIRDSYEKLIKEFPKKSNKPSIVLVKEFDVGYLHEASLAKEAFMQLASQFNFLEAPTSNKTSVSSYVGDKTQGPMGAIEAAAAALHRDATNRVGKLSDALENVLPSDHSNYYKNGYLEIFKVALDKQQELLVHIENNIEKLRILPQYVVNEPSNVRLFQVFSAAPSFQGAPRPDPKSVSAKICEILVRVQYEAIAKMAVIRSLLLNNNVPLHLTLVGQKSFNNPPEVMYESLKAAYDAALGYDVEIFVHGYSDEGQDLVKEIAKKYKIDLKEMTKEEFANHL